MKKAIISIFTWLAFLSNNAQEYKYVPLALEGNTWEYGYYTNTWDHCIYEPYKIKITGDTIVDGIEYKKCYRLFSNDSIPSASNLAGLIRDVVDEKKVYFKGNIYIGSGWSESQGLDPNEEILLYDFANPNNRDSYIVAHNPYSWEDEFYIDSIVVIDGYSRYIFSNSLNGDAILEGVGACYCDMIDPLINAQMITGYPNYYSVLYKMKDASGKILWDNSGKAAGWMGSYNIPKHNYIPIVKDGTIREYEMAYGDGTKTHYKLEINGDTIINGIEYMKCYRHNYQSLDISIMQPRAFMRENDKKVYCVWNKNYKAQSFDAKLTEWENVNRSTENEILLYDFDNVKNSNALVHVDDYYLYYTYYRENSEDININKIYSNSKFMIIENVGIFNNHKGDLINPLIGDFDGSGTTLSYGAVLYPSYWYFYNNIYNPNWQYVSGIENINADNSKTEIERYDIFGRKLNNPTKGINIIKFSDGTSSKVFIK